MKNLLIKTAIVIAVSTSLVGCSGTKQKKFSEVKQDARDRWAETRSGVLFSVAQKQFAAGELDKAERTCAQALQASPNQAAYIELMGQISLERGNLERAMIKLDKAKSLDPQRASTWYYLGVINQRWQRYDAALENYNKAYECAPDHVTHLLASAEMLVKLDRTPEAAQRLADKLTYFDNNPAIRVGLGRIAVLQNDLSTARQYFEQASILAPEDPTIIEHLVMAEVATENYTEATYHLQKLMSRDEYANREDMKLLLGDCFLAMDKPILARVQFLEITQTHPNNIHAWIKLAQAAWFVGDRTRLDEAASRITAMAPTRYEGYLVRGMALQLDGDARGALKQFDQAHEVAPAEALPQIMRGLTLEDLNDNGGAIHAYQQASELAPNDPRPQQLLAAITQ